MTKEWPNCPLGSICTIERGGSPRPIEAYITEEPNGINWIKIGDADETMYITHTAQKIKPEGMKKSRFVQPGDFLLSNSMSFGRPYILKIDGCIHDGWLVLHDEKNTFDKRFLYYLLSAPSTYRRFQSMAVGGVVNNLNSEMVQKLSVPVPSRAVQEEIANRLDVIDALISKHKEQSHLIDQFVKSRFIEMFGDPLTKSKHLKQPICELGTVGTGNTPSMRVSEYYESEDIPFIKPGDMAESGVTIINTAKTAYISENARKVARLMPYNTVMVTCIGTIGKVGIVQRESACNQQINFIIPCASINSMYLAQCLSFYKPVLEEMANAPVVPIINKSQFSGVALPVPPLELQNRFATFVAEVDKSKLAVKQSLERLETLKKSLMQKYFG